MHQKDFGADLEKNIIKICNDSKKNLLNINELISVLKEDENFKKRNNLKKRIFNILKGNKNIKIKGSVQNFNIILKGQKTVVLNSHSVSDKKKRFEKIMEIFLFFKFLMSIIITVDNIEWLLTKIKNKIEPKLEFFIKKNEELINKFKNPMYPLYFSFFSILFFTFLFFAISMSINFFFELFKKIDNLPRSFYDHYFIIYGTIFLLITIFLFSVKDRKIKLIPNIKIITIFFSISCLLSYILKKQLKIHNLSSSTYDQFLDIYAILIFLYLLIIIKNLDSIIIFTLKSLKFLFFSISGFYLLFIQDYRILIEFNNNIEDIYNLSLKAILSLGILNHILNKKEIENLKIKDEQYNDERFHTYSTYNSFGDTNFDLFFFQIQSIILILLSMFMFFLFIIGSHKIIKYILNEYIDKKKNIFSQKIENYINKIFIFFQDEDKKEKEMIFSYEKFSYDQLIIKVFSIFFVFTIFIWIMISNVFFKDLYYSYYTEKNNGYCLNIHKDTYILKTNNRILIDSKYLNKKDNKKELEYKEYKNKKNRFFYYQCEFNEDYED